MKQIFTTKLQQVREVTKTNSVSISKERYKQIIARVKSAKLKARKEPGDYPLLKRYDVLIEDGKEMLIVPPGSNPENLYFVHDEELFDILHEAHSIIGHGGRDKMMRQLRKKYKNITYKDVVLYLNLCEICLQRQNRERRHTMEFSALYQPDPLQLSGLDELGENFADTRNLNQEFTPISGRSDEITTPERKFNLLQKECVKLSRLCSDVSTKVFCQRLQFIKNLIRSWSEENVVETNANSCEVKHEPLADEENSDNSVDNSNVFNLLDKGNVDLNDVPIIVQSFSRD